MPMKNWWAVRLVDPGKFVRLRSKKITTGIQILVGPLKKPPKGATGTHVQTYRFNIGRFKTAKQVKAWLNKNKITKWLEFEKPTGLNEEWVRAQLPSILQDIQKNSMLGIKFQSNIKYNQLEQSLLGDYVEVADQRLGEYNPYHDRLGRFATSKGSAMTVPDKSKKTVTKEKKEKSDGVALSSKETKGIDKVAATLSAKSTEADMDKALGASMKAAGLGQKEADYVKNSLTRLTSDSQGSDGAKVTMALNMARGQPMRSNFSPIMTKAAKGPPVVKKPTNKQVKAMATAQALNQSYLKGQYGTHVTVYRGVRGQYSTDIKASKATNVNIKVRSLSSWTTDRIIADGFSYGKTLLKAKIPISKVGFSHLTSSSLKRYGESEFILHSSGAGLSNVSVVH